ncbi:MAG TPA: hypothetical protein VEB19_16615 [Gemmatimonadaceae bacterium]|nr:hypothetical protein [Gemmatimonadaceae bacterium]
MTTARLLGTWVLMAILMSLNGAFREMVLKPRMTASSADLASACLGAVILLIVSWLFFRPLRGASTPTLLRVSVVLVVLTVAFEFLIGRYVDHKSWSEVLANYELWNGRLWPLLLALIALTPFIWGRWFLPEG